MGYYYLQFPLSFFCQVFLQFEPLFKGRSRFLLLSSSLCVRFKKLLLHFEVVQHGSSSSSWLLAIIELIFPTKDLRRFKEDYVCTFLRLSVRDCRTSGSSPFLHALSPFEASSHLSESCDLWLFH